MKKGKKLASGLFTKAATLLKILLQQWFPLLNIIFKTAFTTMQNEHSGVNGSSSNTACNYMSLVHKQ